MLSEVPSKQTKEGESHAAFPKIQKKMVHRIHESVKVLTNETLDLQVCKRTKAFIVKFLGDEEDISDETSNEMTYRLMKAVKSLKAMRKVVIEYPR